MWTWFVSPLLWVVCVTITSFMLNVEVTWRVVVLCTVATIVDGLLEGIGKKEL